MDHEHLFFNTEFYQEPNYFLRKLTIGTFRWNWSNFTLAMTFTLLVILISTTSTRSLLVQILQMPQKVVSVLVGYCTHHEDEFPLEYNGDDDTSERNDSYNHYDGDNIFIQLRYEIQELLDRLFHIILSALESAQSISRKVMFDVKEEDLLQSNSSMNRMLRTWTQKSDRHQLPNIALPQHHVSDETITANNDNDDVSKPINQVRVSFFDPVMEPAFLNDEDYPDDLMVYDAIQGTLVSRKERKAEKTSYSEAVDVQ
jgi:hypothetical protein